MKRLMNYGCYCQFYSSDYYKRHGLAQDKLDKICQKWKRCINCVALDSGMECFPECKTRLDYVNTVL